MATKMSYLKALNSLRSRTTYKQAFAATLSRMRSQVDLGSVRSCLALGCGDGRDEVKFVKELAANITKFIGVESDHESAERLKDNLTNFLPNVSIQVIEADVKSWGGPDDRVDLVLMFNLLYVFNSSQRQQLFGKLQQHWLTKGGLVAIVHASQTKSPGTAHEIWEILRRPLPGWEDVERDMLEVGFSRQHAYEVPTIQDLSDPDESLLYFYQSVMDRPITLDELRSSITAVSPNGKFKQPLCIAIMKGRN